MHGKITFVLFLMVLSLTANGRGKLNMPHYYSYATCESGKCTKGYGKLRSKTMPISYEGYFDKNNQPTTGKYIVEFKGEQYETHYVNGLPTEGAKLYTLVSNKPDIFVGKFKHYTGPYSKVRIAIPSEGEYTDANGFKYTGTFFSFPSMGLYKKFYAKYPNARRYPSANVIFVGTISYQDQKEVGIYVNESYVIGSKFNNFEPTDETAIRGLKQRFENEYSSHQSRLARHDRNKRRAKVKWGKIFALAAGAVMVSNSRMDADSQSRFISAYTSDIMNGTTSNLSRLSSNMKSSNKSKTMDDVFQQSYKNARVLAAKYKKLKTTKASHNKQIATNRQRQVVSQSPAPIVVKKSPYRRDQSRYSKTANTTRYASNSRKSTQRSGNGKAGSSGTTGSETKKQKKKTPCVARTESGNPLSSGKCGMVFADYSRTLHFDYKDYEKAGGAFMNESGSRAGAEKSLYYAMLKVAKKMCKKDGYETPYLPTDYSEQGLKHRVKSCKDYKRAGSTFYLCRGSSEFSCARYGK